MSDEMMSLLGTTSGEAMAVIHAFARRSKASQAAQKFATCPPAGVRDRLRAEVAQRVLRVIEREKIDPKRADRYYRRNMRNRWVKAG